MVLGVVLIEAAARSVQPGVSLLNAGEIGIRYHRITIFLKRLFFLV